MKHGLFRLLISFFVIVFFIGFNPIQVYADEVQIEFDSLNESTEKGDAEAYYRMGSKYDFGKDVPQDYK